MDTLSFQNWKTLFFYMSYESKFGREYQLNIKNQSIEGHIIVRIPIKYEKYMEWSGYKK